MLLYYCKKTDFCWSSLTQNCDMNGCSLDAMGWIFRGNVVPGAVMGVSDLYRKEKPEYHKKPLPLALC